MDAPVVPDDVLFVVDLAAAVEMREWTSDENSGIRYSLDLFDEDSARALLSREPQIRSSERSEQETIDFIQEHLLLKLRLCWRIERLNHSAARAISIPEVLRRS